MISKEDIKRLRNQKYASQKDATLEDTPLTYQKNDTDKHKHTHAQTYKQAQTITHKDTRAHIHTQSRMPKPPKTKLV